VVCSLKRLRDAKQNSCYKMPEAIKVGVRQLENFHLMQRKAQICVVLT